jgi:hypothetical protein
MLAERRCKVEMYEFEVFMHVIEVSREAVG